MTVLGEVPQTVIEEAQGAILYNPNRTAAVPPRILLTSASASPILSIFATCSISAISTLIQKSLYEGLTLFRPPLIFVGVLVGKDSKTKI